MNEPDPSTDLPSQYAPASVEGPLYERWVEAGLFRPEVAGPDAEPYTIVIPPPNVTGELHMGHALEHTLMDALTRRARMQGKAALWLPGTDHASIAVETLVERSIAEQDGTTKQQLGREKFLERAWEWKEEFGGRILGQMRRLGDGVDWSRLAFTMSPELSSAVRRIFKQLFDAGLIYRAERLVNWSPLLHTAISDIEVEYKDVDGELVTIDYGNGVHVATTRVETMLGDTAVAVHPDDERYRHLVGTTLTLPIVGRPIVVVADEHVDPEFGTGAVKVTPAHDPNDFAIAQRHDLPAITVMDEDARIAGTGTRFDGMDRYEARKAVKDELASLGLIVAEKSPYTHSVGHSSRSHEAIEPRLSLQWWVKVDGLAKAAGDAVRDGRTVFNPPEMAQRYFAWVDDMHDWCISRQLYWGHRIPVWYGPDGQIVCPAEGDEPTGEGWHQDKDVLDTWFSSALWPFSTLGWPDETADLARFYPTTVLVTGYDIIFFWVARMMMFSLFAMQDVPFTTVHIHGLVRDATGKKMSKSRGNVVDPLEWIDAYGADALRFALARGANPGTDFPLSEDSVKGARNFTNKVWNAVRFALISGASVPDALPASADLTDADRWVLSRLNTVAASTNELFEGFEFAKLSEQLYGFAWNEVFDWYVEVAKVQIREGGTRAATTRSVLGHVLDVLLRLMHPLTPFLTEALWTTLTGNDTVVTAPWPTGDATRVDPDAEARFDRLRAVVTEVRRARAEQNVAPKTCLPAHVAGELDLDALATLTNLEYVDAPAAGGVTVTAAGIDVTLDLSGTVDVEAQRQGWQKDLAEAEKELERQRTRLSSPAADKAPPNVVQDWKRREAEADAEVQRLRGLLGLDPG
ncbi:MAG TPA: valine--tRNA ligase [Mycobacteriales bacterium]|nr:valine--tRNA ligase [Mycobacteriales bacterium]